MAKLGVCESCGREITIIGRGLCSSCYKRNRAAGTLPPKKRGLAKPAPPRRAAFDPEVAMAAESPPAVPAPRNVADETIAVLTEFATAAGIAHTPMRGGILFTCERFGDAAIQLTSVGTIRRLRITPETG